MAKSKLARNIAVGAAIAGAAGYVAGILSAPNEGKKTRKQLKKTAEHSITDVEKQLKQLHGDLGDLMSRVKDQGDDTSKHAQKKFSGAISNANDAKDKLREVLTSVRAGEAGDKDLKRALQDAKRSLEHLKHFIKK